MSEKTFKVKWTLHSLLRLKQRFNLTEPPLITYDSVKPLGYISGHVSAHQIKDTNIVFIRNIISKRIITVVEKCMWDNSQASLNMELKKMFNT